MAIGNLLPRLGSGAREAVPLLLSWPGAGTLVFWQLGVIKGLAARYDLQHVPMLGSSSGALVCAMAKSGACMDMAASRGLELLGEHGVMDRSWGLVGILGRLTRHWMQDILPDDAGARCSGGAASLLVTTLPFMRTRAITDFTSKRDLINCVMASSHIPVVVDMRMWVSCRWRPCLDGGLWWLLQRSVREYQPSHALNTLLVTPFEDPNVVQDLHILRKLRPADLNGMHQLWEMGEQHAGVLAARHHHLLEALTRPTSTISTKHGAAGSKGPTTTAQGAGGTTTTVTEGGLPLIQQASSGQQPGPSSGPGKLLF